MSGVYSSWETNPSNLAPVILADGLNHYFIEFWILPMVADQSEVIALFTWKMDGLLAMGLMYPLKFIRFTDVIHMNTPPKQLTLSWLLAFVSQPSMALRIIHALNPSQLFQALNFSCPGAQTTQK